MYRLELTDIQNNLIVSVRTGPGYWVIPTINDPNGGTIEPHFGQSTAPYPIPVLESEDATILIKPNYAQQYVLKNVSVAGASYDVEEAPDGNFNLNIYNVLTNVSVSIEFEPQVAVPIFDSIGSIFNMGINAASKALFDYDPRLDERTISERESDKLRVNHGRIDE
jgi:hypothetical protein